MRLLSGLIILLLLVFPLSVVASCSSWPGTPPIVKVGLVAPFEGLYRAVGYEVLPAVKMALREWNDTGGVGGYMVELVALNDHQDPTMAWQRAREMVADPDIMGVIGHFDVRTTTAALSVYGDAGLALIVPSGTFVGAAGIGYSQTFRLGAESSILGMAAADYALAEKGARRLAVIRGQEDLAGSFVDAALEGGASVVLDLSVEEEGLLAALADESPDMVFFAGGGVEGGELLLRLREAGIDTPLLGGNGLNTRYLVQIAGDAAEGTTYVTLTPPVADQGFIDGYMALSGPRPGPYAPLAYDATQLLLKAMQEAIAVDGRATRDGVVAALSQSDGYSGLTGHISFDEHGRALNPRVYVYEIVDGQYPGELRK